jgi:hypothetical protein
LDLLDIAKNGLIQHKRLVDALKAVDMEATINFTQESLENFCMHIAYTIRQALAKLRWLKDDMEKKTSRGCNVYESAIRKASFLL